MTPLLQLAEWPLRLLGLEPGRALSNARPDPAQRDRDRLEQYRMISTRLAVDSAARSTVVRR